MIDSVGTVLSIAGGYEKKKMILSFMDLQVRYVVDLFWWLRLYSLIPDSPRTLLENRFRLPSPTLLYSLPTEVSYTTHIPLLSSGSTVSEERGRVPTTDSTTSIPQDSSRTPCGSGTWRRRCASKRRRSSRRVTSSAVAEHGTRS